MARSGTVTGSLWPISFRNAGATNTWKPVNAETGLPGSPQDKASPALRRYDRLPGTHRHVAEEDLASGPNQRRPHEVVLADRYATGENEHIAGQPFGDHQVERRAVVSGDAEITCVHADRLKLREQHPRVRIAHLMGSGMRVDLDDLVPRRHHHDPWKPHDGDARAADGGQRRHLGGADDRPPFDHGRPRPPVFALAPDVLSNLWVLFHEHGRRVSVLLGQLDHDDRIGATRNHATGEDAHRLPHSHKGRTGILACTDLAGHRERASGLCAVRRAHRETVHR